MKKMIPLLIAAITCIPAIMLSATYTLTPLAQQLVNKELKELMILRYLTPECAYLQQIEVDGHKELIVVLPAHEWDRITRKASSRGVGSLFCNACCGILIGTALGAAIGWVAFNFIIGIPFPGGYVSFPPLGAFLGAIFGGAVGFFYGLITGVVKLCRRVPTAQKVDTKEHGHPHSKKETAAVAVRFPVLAQQLKELAASGDAIYLKSSSADEPGFSVIV